MSISFLNLGNSTYKLCNIKLYKLSGIVQKNPSKQAKTSSILMLQRRNLLTKLVTFFPLDFIQPYFKNLKQHFSQGIMYWYVSNLCNIKTCKVNIIEAWQVHIFRVDPKVYANWKFWSWKRVKLRLLCLEL